MTNLLSELLFSHVRSGGKSLWSVAIGIKLIFLWTYSCGRYCVRHFCTFISYSQNWQWICSYYIKQFYKRENSERSDLLNDEQERRGRAWPWDFSSDSKFWGGRYVWGLKLRLSHNHKGKQRVPYLWMNICDECSTLSSFFFCSLH